MTLLERTEQLTDFSLKARFDSYARVQFSFSGKVMVRIGAL